MLSGEDFVSKVCDDFKKAFDSASQVTLEGREREFRRVLARYLFDETLGWEDHSKIGEIYDITCFDDENFPIILVETKWNMEPTSEIKEKLRKRIEELGSVEYGVFASERDFIVYMFDDYKLKDLVKINVAEATGAAKGQYGLSEVVKKHILKLESLKRERLVQVEDPDYFEKTYKEVSVVKGEGVKILTRNLKDIVSDLTLVLMNFFDSYWRRKEHYSGKFLENIFDDWLRISTKDEDFKKGPEEERKKILEVFCRETSYVLVGRLLFIRMVEDKNILEQTMSGKRFAEFLRFYEKRKENVYLRAFYDSREEIKVYYRHLHELGFFDWWIIDDMKKGTLSYDDGKLQMSLEKDLDYSLKKAFRKLNRFDFAKVNRDILGDVYQGYLPPQERKQLGEFYTPIEVIEYIMDSVEYRYDKEIRSKTILDPACGSGSFLVEATQRLVERYKRLGFNLRDPDYAKQVIEGCISSIYGLDLHPFACFIAEMNLLFQLVELYDVVRQKYTHYELPRINVYRTDSLAPPGATAELTEFFENSRRKMLVQEMKEGDMVKKVKFDFVVGNPPYVRKERISADYKEKVLKIVFPEVYHGDNDLYVYFIAKGLDQLKEGGMLGYIVSNKFSKTRYGQNIRDFILSSSSIMQFLDFGLIDVFKEVANLPLILVLKKESEKNSRAANRLQVTVAKKEKGHAGDLMKYIKEKVGKGTFSDDFVDVFDIPQASLDRQVWKLVPSYVSKVFRKIKENSDYPLGKVCRVYYCVKTGLNRVGKQGVMVVTREEVNEFNLEKTFLRPVLKGEDVRRFRIDYKDNFLIFPYNKEEIDGQYQYRTIDIENYPNLFRHLNRFKKDLENRSDIRKTDSKWYELRPCNYYHIFESEKIITPDISKKSNFAYDDGKYFCLDSCFMIALRDEYKKELMEKSKSFLKYLLGLLNSEVLEFCFKQTSTFVLGRHYRYKVEYLEPLQIKAITNGNQILTSRIIEITDRILRINEESEKLDQKLGNFPYSYFKEDCRFDKLVNVLKAQNLSKESYAVSLKSLRTDYRQKGLDGSETFRIILGASEFIDLGSEQVASYVFEILKNVGRITKRELLEMRIPQQEHLKITLSQFRHDKEKIVKDAKTVRELEKQIDDLVYRLYNIDLGERRVIEGYLKKF